MFIGHDLVYLGQEEWWITKDRKRVRISDMEQGHARNAAALLERGAARFRSTTRMRSDLLELLRLPNPADLGDVTASMLEHENDLIAQEVMARTDTEWIRTTTLHQALVDRSRAPGTGIEHRIMW